MHKGLLTRMFGALSPVQSAGRFALRVLLLSVAALVPVLALYLAQVPGMATHVLGGGPASTRFLRQVLSNGVPVVFAMNWAALMLLHPARASRPDLPRLLLADATVRLGLFAGLHVAVFAASAVAFGSFGGDPVQALRVVAPTLGAAAGFGNLSGVYLYAGVLAALPLHAALFQRHLSAPQPGLPWLAACVVLGLQVAFLSALARLLAG